ncbi:MAG TPA: NmrA family NAD(P)-binding protein [Ktedonobacteraceae bacterium]|nr:NmrA family NAD(P)-binding protein [Ktedonobacteraceae bacterium]
MYWLLRTSIRQINNLIFHYPIAPDTPYPLVAVSDIAVFVALSFASPDTYLGKTIELVGHAPTPPQIAASISRAIGRSISYVQAPIELLRLQNAEIARACEFLNENHSTVDISALRKLHPGLMDFETWLQKEGKARFTTLRNE